MSLNNVLGKLNPVSLIELKASLDANENAYKDAQYLEDLREIEFSTISFEESLRKLEESIIELNEFDQLDLETNQNVSDLINFKMRLLYEKKKYLTQLFTDYKNRSEVLKQTLSGKSREIRQKISSLDNIKDEVKFNLTESFENLFNVNFDGIKNPRLMVDTRCKAATLPEEGSEMCTLNKIFLGSESNGTTGAYQTNEYALPYYLVDNNEETFFEYHKEDTGPLVCEIVFDFDREYIANSVLIKKNNKSSGEDIRVEDIVYSSATGIAVSYKKLVDMKKQSNVIESVNNGGELLIKHLPIKASRAKIVLVQEIPKTLFIDNIRKEIYNICIEKVMFKETKYSSKGGFRSNIQITPEGYYNIFAEIKSYPKEQIGFKNLLNLSLDGGGEYSPLDFVSSKTKSLISDGKQKSIEYEYTLERSFLQQEEKIEKESIFKTFSRKKKTSKSVSEDEIPLSEKYLKSSLNVVERITSRSEDLDKAISIATSYGKDVVKANLPFVLSDEKIFKEDLEIYINGIKTENYTLDNNLQSVSFDFSGEDNNNLKRIKALLRPYEPEIIAKPEGYYISIPETFDYDLENISIKSFKNAERYKEIIPAGTKEFYTKYKNLEGYLIKGSETGALARLDSVSSREGLVIFEETTTEKYTINYSYKKEVDVNNFYIWFSEEKPAGLFIDQSSFSGNKVEETLGAGTNSFDLEEKNIVLNSVILNKEDFVDDYKEVRYADGKTEFLNLARMTEEKIPAIETEDGYVSFKLSKKNIINTEDVFLYERGSSNQYNVIFGELPNNPVLNTLYIVNENDCVLFIEENSISENLYVDYWYSSTVDQIKKFSVNSKEGKIFFSDEEHSGKRISYQTGRLKVEYDIVQYLESDSDDRNVSFRTSKMIKNRNTVKAIWGTPVGSIDYSQMEEYYSPIIYEVMIGMN